MFGFTKLKTPMTTNTNPVVNTTEKRISKKEKDILRSYRSRIYIQNWAKKAMTRPRKMTSTIAI